MIDFRRIQVVTFDCYGTLIDWESGILEALAPFRTVNRIPSSDNEILEQYAALEALLETGEHIRYRDILRGVMRGLAGRYSVASDRYEVDLLADSLPAWRPFPDTVESLRRLKQHYRLAVISNTDDDLFAQTARTLEVPFDWVITAEQVGAYKPSHQNFLHALEVMGMRKENVLHAAQSRFHDVAPARELGIASVWVNRRRGKAGEGATTPSSAVPDLEVPDLETLADKAIRGTST